MGYYCSWEFGSRIYNYESYTDFDLVYDFDPIPGISTRIRSQILSVNLTQGQISILCHFKRVAFFYESFDIFMRIQTTATDRQGI